MAAQESLEPTLIKLFKRGKIDIHRAIAALIYHIPEDQVTDEQRFNAKTCNFLILYGGGASTLAQAIKKPVSEASDILAQWHSRFPRWERHVAQVEASIIKNHYVRNLFGRYRNLFIIDPSTKEGKATLRQGVNAPIQGDLTDYNKLTGYNIWKRTRHTSAKFIMETHDQWMMDIKNKDVPHVAQIIKEECEYVDTSKFGFKFTVPMEVEIKVGPNGKDMEIYG